MEIIPVLLENNERKTCNESVVALITIISLNEAV
jgi:hypothetical protein